MEADYADISKLDSVILRNIRGIRKNVLVDLNTMHVFITKYDRKLTDKNDSKVIMQDTKFCIVTVI